MAMEIALHQFPTVQRNKYTLSHLCFLLTISHWSLGGLLEHVQVNFRDVNTSKEGTKHNDVILETRPRELQAYSYRLNLILQHQPPTASRYCSL